MACTRPFHLSNHLHEEYYEINVVEMLFMFFKLKIRVTHSFVRDQQIQNIEQAI